MDWQTVRGTFQKIWGYDDFRPPQGEIVRCLLSGQDALIVLPTGGGKSICFQLPALLQTGLTLVVSPLVALMENQVQELRDRNLPAASLHSQIPASQRKQIFKKLERQTLRLLYLSPETLLSSPVWQCLIQPDLKINGLILDEAHCLVQWGEVFRPAYRRLGAVRLALLQSKPSGSKMAIAAFTATADPHARETITRCLQLKQPQPFLLSPYRKNLKLTVQIVWTPRGRKQKMLKFIESKRKQAGLVYVRSRSEGEELAQWFASLKYNVEAYHAGLSAEQRREIEDNWLRGKTQFVVCTSAFGMGINKPNVRWVVHFQAPQLISEYIQEVGRGGRDGKIAEALTLMSEPTGLLNPEDKQRNTFFAQKQEKQYRKAQKLAQSLPDRGQIEAISKQFPGGAIALSLLHSAEQLEWQDPFNYRLVGKLNATSLQRSLQHLSAKQTQILKQMQQYLITRGCRWQFLLNAFGFAEEAIAFRCGHCDNCQK
ncbi:MULTISPECIES: ATP-dependent DNA helicase RecQ [Spirulina sp. CCY15215]|uniref:RecQ family ATP-dependent DNA helicase n=1 Tax=Spirulina sp. CCY15215 TaxID=2767591 RepID=UPI00194F71D0|nr:ATP-dependent DNA helicase RecQ [Spirulina major]